MRLSIAFVFFIGLASAHAAGDVRQFDFGAYHRCSLDAGGAVDCLGESNHFGQVGNGGKEGEESATPRPVRVIARGARKVSTAAFYSCAIVGDALQCWGDMAPRKGGTRKPVVLIEHGVSDMAAGNDRVCAIVGTAVQCIGKGGGSGSNEYQNAHPTTPETVIEHGATAVAVGLRYACAVVDGALWCWGEVPSYAWNAPDRFVHPLPPTRLIEHGVTSIAAGEKHACAIVDGALRCWGDNSRGQVGTGIPEVAPAAASAQPVVTKVEGEQRCERYREMPPSCRVEHPVEVIAEGVESVVAKNDATCAIAHGALYCWGQNLSGQLGVASHGTNVTKPTLAIAGGVSYVATGSRTCALVAGTLQCSRPCATINDRQQCPPDAGFDARDVAFGLSSFESRLGVWRGTIGTHGVMVCLQRPYSDAMYYYLEHRLSNALSPEPNTDGATWTERTGDSTPSGTWTLDTASGDTLAGRWSDPAGQRTLPIRLTRVAAPGDPGSACGSVIEDPARRLFDAPRVDAQTIKAEPWDEHARKVTALDGSIAAIEFLDDVANAKPFNAAMRGWLRDEIAGYYDCMFRAPSQGAAGGTPQGAFSGSLEVEWRADPWIVLRELYESDCGGAHPNGGVAGYWVWNLAEGKRVEPWDWIVTMGKTGECPYLGCERQPTDELNDLIVAAATRNKDGDECADSVNEYRKYGFYQLRPNAEGLVFSTDFARVIQACDEDVQIPWAKLAPFLSAQGRKAMQSIQRVAGGAEPKTR